MRTLNRGLLKVIGTAVAKSWGRRTRLLHPVANGLPFIGVEGEFLLAPATANRFSTEDVTLILLQSDQELIVFKTADAGSETE